MASASAAEPEFRVFESTDGAKIEAEIIASRFDGLVTIRRKDGQVFENVPTSRFSAADQKYISEWREAVRAKYGDTDLDSNARLKISVLKGKDDAINRSGGVDDRVVSFEPEVLVESDESVRTFRQVKGTVVLIGRGVIQKSAYVVLSREDFSMDIHPQEKSRWKGQKFQCRYDPDFGGFEYSGYLVVLRNKNGEVVFTKASSSTWERAAPRVLSSKKRTGYERDFSRELPLDNHFGLPR